MSKKDRIKEIFTKLKEGHTHWSSGDLAYKERIEKLFEPMFIELRSLGVERNFAESLLYFGKVFVDSFDDNLGMVDVGSQKKKLQDPQESDSALESAEKIFGSGAKRSPLSGREIKEMELANKYDAIVWTANREKRDKISINILAYKKDSVEA